MKKIKISNSNNKFFVVDDEDFSRTNYFKWSLSSRIIKTRIGDKTVTIGRFILNYSGKNQVDHIDGSLFNNQKSNLRICTQQQNQINRDYTSINTSGYRGVSWNYIHNKWHVQIQVNKVKKNLGFFDNIKAAAEVYNKAATKYHGEFAILNIIKYTGQEVCNKCNHLYLLHDGLNQECSACDSPEVPLDKKCQGFRPKEGKENVETI